MKEKVNHAYTRCSAPPSCSHSILHDSWLWKYWVSVLWIIVVLEGWNNDSHIMSCYYILIKYILVILVKWNYLERNKLLNCRPSLIPFHRLTFYYCFNPHMLWIYLFFPLSSYNTNKDITFSNVLQEQHQQQMFWPLWHCKLLFTYQGNLKLKALEGHLHTEM